MKILLIEDNPDHIELIEECCHSAFTTNCNISTYNTLADGVAALQSGTFDIALIDLSFPDSDIDATTKVLRDLESSIPIIVLTSLQDEEIGRQLVKDGVQDYLPKDSLQKTLLQRMTLYAIERKRHQVQLIDNAANQQAFCRSLSHDFKAPLRNLDYLNTILKEQLSQRQVLLGEDLSMFDKIEHRLLAMTHLVDGLNNYLQVEQVSTISEQVDLNLIMFELRLLLTSDLYNNASITFEKLPTIQGNRAQIYILLQNILQNALKYCNTSPIVTVTALEIKQSSAGKNEVRHQINICDNGIGIENSFVESIFKPFHRLHSESEYPGSGLGLSVVQRIMNNHNGEVSVTSELGKGSCFSLTFI
ncbi:ATP-binding protein [Paraglaciecola arctica]|uniref:ATP-binding protein n=1 Tax=Paraglaciecola arctica TaxID=1128911 RepID=UPI001C069C05|nr:ATP-binding protein [Paraglaciecola arctica]MBU3004598.1 response regulator [Paraglaciecola arctica]